MAVSAVVGEVLGIPEPSARFLITLFLGKIVKQQAIMLSHARGARAYILLHQRYEVNSNCNFSLSLLFRVPVDGGGVPSHI